MDVDESGIDDNYDGFGLANDTSRFDQSQKSMKSISKNWAANRKKSSFFS